MSSQGVPIWAIQRVNAVLAAENNSGPRPTNEVLARRTGLSKRLIRRCLIQSANKPADPGPQPFNPASAAAHVR